MGPFEFQMHVNIGFYVWYVYDNVILVIKKWFEKEWVVQYLYLSDI